jgi:hypothetical protein
VSHALIGIEDVIYSSMRWERAAAPDELAERTCAEFVLCSPRLLPRRR